MKNKKITISILNQGEIRPEIADMLFKLQRQGKYHLTVEYPAKKPISYNRNDICKRFLETDHDYLLMFDGDCIPENIERILDMADYDKDIIGATCFGFVNRMIVPFAMKQRPDFKYDVIDTDLNNGVIEVDAIGSGVMMIARRVLEKLPYPFRNEYDPEGMKTKGLDFNFCRRAKLLGFKVWVDTDNLTSHWTTIDLLTMWKTFDGMIKMIEKLKSKVGYNNDIDGWMFPEQLNWLYNASKEMDSVVEIGSWKGKSTHALLSGCKGIVYSVEPFDGKMTKDITGEEQYKEFIKNVGHFKNLKSYKDYSKNVAKEFKDKVDMVFIDGDHKYESVKEDIKLWLPKTNKLICGHDYQGEDVRRAVNEVLGEVDNINNIWFKVL